MMRATLEATTDGILVTDERRQRHRTSTRSSSRCGGCPRELMEPGEHRQLARARRAGSSTIPRRFLARIDEIYATSPPESFDVLELADGRVFERFSTDPARRRAERRPRLELSRHHRAPARRGSAARRDAHPRAAEPDRDRDRRRSSTCRRWCRRSPTPPRSSAARSSARSSTTSTDEQRRRRSCSTRCRARRARRSRSSASRAPRRSSARRSAARRPIRCDDVLAGPALRPDGAAPRHAAGPPAGAQLPRRAGDLALGRGDRRAVLRPSRAGRLHRAHRAAHRRRRRAGGGRHRQRAPLRGGAAGGRGAQAAARERARGARRGRARRADEGRVPRHAVARAAHAAQRDPRLGADPARAAPQRRPSCDKGSRRSSATRACRRSSSRTCST